MGKKELRKRQILHCRCVIYTCHFGSDTKEITIFSAYSYKRKMRNVVQTLFRVASPCIIILSTESTNQMQQLLKFITCRLTLKTLN